MGAFGDSAHGVLPLRGETLLNQGRITVFAKAALRYSHHRDRPRLSARARATIVCAAIALLAVVHVLAPTAAQGLGRGPSATDAGTISIHESGTLRLVSHQGTKILHEQGQTSGTFHANVTSNVNISYTQANVSFTITSSSGSVTGEGVESYYVSGKNGHFNGNVSITRGTGQFSHARASELHISGLIKRAHYELTLQVSGSLRD